MKQFTCLMLISGLALATAGCNRNARHESEQSQTKSAKSIDPQIQQEERALEQQAQRAKQDIDAITKAAEKDLEKSGQHVQAAVKKPVKISAERASELAEEAKDRAEDLPEQEDQDVARRTPRVREASRRFESADEAAEGDRESRR